MQASPEQITDFRIEDLAARLKVRAPELWAFVRKLQGGRDGTGVGGGGAVSIGRWLLGTAQYGLKVVDSWRR